jgi:hypothetical protein
MGAPSRSEEEWRRGRDSNPGPGSTPGNRLAGGCLRPTRPPLRAQRPHLLGGHNLCQLSGRLWDGWRRGRDSNPRGLAPIPVFKSRSGGHPCRPLPTNPKSFLPIGYYAFGAVWGMSTRLPAQNPHTRGASGDRRAGGSAPREVRGSVGAGRGPHELASPDFESCGPRGDHGSPSGGIVVLIETSGGSAMGVEPMVPPPMVLAQK